MAARGFLRQNVLKSAFKLTCNQAKSVSSSSNLIKLVQAQSLTSTSLKARCLSQCLPALGFQVQRNLAVGPNLTNLLDKFATSKPSALALAINESEITSVDECDDEDEATLYILSEMFSTLSTTADIG